MSPRDRLGASTVQSAVEPAPGEASAGPQGYRIRALCRTLPRRGRFKTPHRSVRWLQMELTFQSWSSELDRVGTVHGRHIDGLASRGFVRQPRIETDRMRSFGENGGQAEVSRQKDIIDVPLVSVRDRLLCHKRIPVHRACSPRADSRRSAHRARDDRPNRDRLAHPEHSVRRLDAADSLRVPSLKGAPKATHRRCLPASHIPNWSPNLLWNRCSVAIAHASAFFQPARASDRKNSACSK